MWGIIVIAVVFLLRLSPKGWHCLWNYGQLKLREKPHILIRETTERDLERNRVGRRCGFRKGESWRMGFLNSVHEPNQVSWVTSSYACMRQAQSSITMALKTEVILRNKTKQNKTLPKPLTPEWLHRTNQRQHNKGFGNNWDWNQWPQKLRESLWSTPTQVDCLLKQTKNKYSSEDFSRTQSLCNKISMIYSRSTWHIKNQEMIVLRENKINRCQPKMTQMLNYQTKMLKQLCFMW